MEKEPQAVEEQVEITAEASTEDEQETYGPPTGAFALVILILLFYGIYWLISYVEIFVLRGA